MNAKLELELDEQCPNCRGTGKELDHWRAPTEATCSLCAGRGRTITAEGHKLIEFLNRYIDWLDVEKKP